MDNYFSELNKVDCSKHVEKKGKFSYLSWPFAVGELLKRHPDATWRVFENPDGLPYFKTETGYYVKVGATVNSVERVQWHPVLTQGNKTDWEPDAFQINTSIQRGLVKAIALHGLGLYIYAGEDLPEGDGAAPQEPITPTGGAWEAESEESRAFLQKVANEVLLMMKEGDDINAYNHILEQKFGAEEYTAFWTRFTAAERKKLKNVKDSIKKEQRK